jgi:CyaY protein
MDEQTFRRHADDALDDLNTSLIEAADDHGFDVDFQSGALGIEFETPPSKFVVSPNTPARQVWVSALSKSFKLDWKDEEHVFQLAETGESLHALLARLIGIHLNTDVFL